MIIIYQLPSTVACFLKLFFMLMHSSDVYWAPTVFQSLERGIEDQTGPQRLGRYHVGGETKRSY